jgi:hypothetical protein
VSSVRIPSRSASVSSAIGWVGCWRPNLGQETCLSESNVAYSPYSAFVEIVCHEDRRSLHNSLKFPLGRLNPCLHPWPSSTFFRRQQGLKRFRQCLREGLRDRDHTRHSNGTTVVPAIGANNRPSPELHGIPMSHTGSPSATAAFRFRQRHSSHKMCVLLKPFSGDDLT